MARDRMDRDEFFKRLSRLDEERLEKTLWSLYRRGNAEVRQRIESQLERGPAAPPFGDELHVAKRGERLELRRVSGATPPLAGATPTLHLGTARRELPRQRRRWRLTVSRLGQDTEVALQDDGREDRADEPVLLLELARDSREYELLADGSVDAPSVVVSDELSLLWSRPGIGLHWAKLGRQAMPPPVRREPSDGSRQIGAGRPRNKAALFGAMWNRMSATVRGIAQ
jgi:hypothetical protein